MPNFTTILTNLQKVPATAKIFFLQNLSVMVKTGVPLIGAVKTLKEQTKNRKLRLILTDLEEKIRQGKNFGECLEPYQKDFGELFINMIKAGEASGNLEEILNRLYLQTKKDHALKMKVRNAMTYPTIIVIAMLGIGGFVVFFVLPNITKLFIDLNVELPLATKILIAVSNFAQANGILTAVSLLIIIAVFTKVIRTKKGKYLFDALILKLPIIASIIKKINLARTARGLSSLIKTDIAITETLGITSRMLGNYHYRQALSTASEQVKKGEKLEIIFKNYPKIFPPVITQMIAVGEETGTLDEVLENLANFYEEEVFQTMDTLPTIIEPILMLLIGFGVAGIALAVLMPMYSLTEHF